MKMEKKIALVVGATGLIGQEVVRLLLASAAYDKVKVVLRRPYEINHPKLEEHIIDFHELKNYDIGEVDHIYCCLGTTMKKAKTKELFKQVDYEYPLELAMKASEQDVSQFLVVSAMGADPASSFFYNRTKGELEAALKSLDLHALHIFRPSLLLGERREFRLGEELAAWLSKLIPFKGSMEKYRPIKGKDVALAMVKIAQAETSGNHLYLSPLIQKIASGKKPSSPA